jgi:hypothetical protein
MLPPRSIILALGLLLCCRFADAQTVINSTFLNRPQWPAVYSDANNWSPNGVPNDTPDRRYNVTIDIGHSVSVDRSTAASISNLTLGSSLPILILDGGSLTVTGTTNNQLVGQGLIDVFAYDNGPPAKFDAGTLSTFSNRVLSGNYSVSSLSNSATLQFNGADIATLANGSLSISGGLSKVVDEFGNDALRNLARIDGTGALRLNGRSAVTNAPFRNDGILYLYNGTTPVTFVATAGLTNFDSSNRTLSGGSFQLIGDTAGHQVELRFPGADIVNLGSSIQLQGTGVRIADLAGNDGLRNLAHILPGAELELDEQGRTIAGPLRNDGVLSVRDYSACTITMLTNFDASTRTLSGGTFNVENSTLKFGGADIVNNGASVTLAYGGSITDITGSNGLRNFSNNLAGAAFVLGQGEDFTAPGDFANAGTVQTVGYYGGIPENPPAFGTFTVASGFAYTQTAGTTINDGTLTADRINIFGGSLVSDIGTINGNVTVTDATVSPGSQPVVNGNVTLNSGSHYHISIDRFGETGALSVGGTVAVAGTLDIEISDQAFLGSDAVLTVLDSNTSITGAFANAPAGARVPTVDGRGSFAVVYEAKRVTLTQFMAAPPPAQLVNISTRALVFRPSDDTFGDRRLLIGGFIISGAEPKTVALRGIGPSLSRFGLEPTLANPVLELHASDGGVMAANDNWRDTQPTEILQSGLAPQDEREAVIITTLSPGSYTVWLKEKSGLAGYGLVEVYDLSKSSSSKLANISTRGYTDANTVLIGGIIVGGDGQANDDVVIRAIGPQMRQNGVFDALQDPTLELRDSNGSLLAFNDDWLVNSDQVPAELHPSQSTESAMRVSLAQGVYTAIVRPKGNSGGVALVEFYDLRR